MPAHNTVVLSKEEETVSLANVSSEATAQLLLIAGSVEYYIWTYPSLSKHLLADRLVMIIFYAGEPLGEPVAQHGPFVMNTAEELQQTISDYQLGRNGFENAQHWKSNKGN